MLHRPFNFNKKGYSSSDRPEHKPISKQPLSKNTHRDGKYAISIEVGSLNGKISKKEGIFSATLIKMYSGYVFCKKSGGKVVGEKLYYLDKNGTYVPLKTKELSNGKREFLIRTSDLPNNTLKIVYKCKFKIDGKFNQFKIVACGVEKHI